MWNARYPRLKLENKGDALSLTKLTSAKTSDERGLIFVLIGFAILLLWYIYHYFFATANTIGPVQMLLSCAFLAAAMYDVFKQLEKLQVENIPQKELIIHDATVSLRIDDEETLEAAITNINFYWKETDSSYDATLDLALDNGKTIRVDTDGDYRELFLISDTIQEQTGIGMQVTDCDSPSSYTQAL